MTHRGVRLLAVDLDGTLVDSAPDIAHCLGNALVAVGCSAPGEVLTRQWIGDGLDALIARALRHATGVAAEASLHAEALAAFLKCYRDNLFVRSRLYPDALATLDVVLASGVKLCCITNKRFDLSDALLRQAGVHDRFDLLLGGDSLTEKKPSPLPLIVAAETFGVAPAEAALAGDSAQDFGAATAAGFQFVFASYGYGRIDAEGLGPNARIERFAQLTTVLGISASG